MKRRLGLLAGSALASVAAAATAAARANAAERANPPKGQFIVVDGVLLHFIELGAGDPIVLLRGNGVSSEDFLLCGAAERLADAHRVIIFDPPGFGYSARPRTKRWTPQEQASCSTLRSLSCMCRVRRSLGTPGEPLWRSPWP